MSILIIAEAGVNHNGDMRLAEKLIDVAVEAGADMVKFQTFRAATLVAEHAPKAGYQKATTDATESQFEMIRRLELSREMHEELIAYCKTSGIEFFSTGFDIASVDMLVGLGIGMFKVPSGELTNLPYLRHVGRFGKPVILSTGMGTMDEVGDALSVLMEAGTSREQITVLHCTTEYPAPKNEVNLRAMGAIAERYGVAVGYSDHTEGIEVPIAAAALGASVIEKHFTLDRKLPGPDHKASLEPDQLKAMVAAIRNIELALGDPVKRVTPSEVANIAIARKSIVASLPIRAGEVYTQDNIAVKRPGTGISPMRWDAVIGKRAPRDFARDELIEL
jgi:N,N'-diacetyllegionaminate synthase